MPRDRRRRHVLQVELQATRQHGHRNALRVGGREHEHDVRRWLLERLEHRVERVRGEHVDFVDDVDLVAPRRRRVDGVLEQLRHLVDAAVRRRVELDAVDEAPGVDARARLARAARARLHAALAVQRLGQDARDRRLADAARAGEQVRVMQPTRFERVRERAHDVLLADQGVEVPGSPLAGQREMGHVGIRDRAKRAVTGDFADDGEFAGRKPGGRAGTPARAGSGCGCFLPDLTRLTTPHCGEARPRRF